MLSKKEKFGHAVGGVGHNLIYALFSGYLLIFYTDVFKLSPVFTGVLFLVARIWDAVNDPMLGIIADRTRSRYGRYRVWLMRAAPVIALALILCFIVPDITKTLQYIYCYVTYILLGMSFTCADVPYWTLPSVMTPDAAERSRVFSISSMATCVASGIGAVAVPMIVTQVGDYAAGYLACAIIFSAIGIVCYYVCAAMVRERVQPAREKVPMKELPRIIFRNKPLLVIMAASLFGNCAFQLKVAVNTYYGTYALGDYGTVTLLSAMLLVGMLAGAACVPALIARFGAKASMEGCLGAGIVLSAAYWFAGYSNLAVVLVFSALAAVVIGAFAVLVNSMTADSIDYAELKFGRRTEGIITSTRTFITKLATAISGAAAALALEFIHYVPNVKQTLYVKDSFQAMMSLWPAVLYAAALMVMIFYPLSREGFEKMEQKLGEVRSAK